MNVECLTITMVQVALVSESNELDCSDLAAVSLLFGLSTSTKYTHSLIIVHSPDMNLENSFFMPKCLSLKRVNFFMTWGSPRASLHMKCLGT